MFSKPSNSLPGQPPVTPCSPLERLSATKRRIRLRSNAVRPPQTPCVSLYVIAWVETRQAHRAAQTDLAAGFGGAALFRVPGVDAVLHRPAAQGIACVQVVNASRASPLAGSGRRRRVRCLKVSPRLASALSQRESRRTRKGHTAHRRRPKVPGRHTSTRTQFGTAASYPPDARVRTTHTTHSEPPHHTRARSSSRWPRSFPSTTLMRCDLRLVRQCVRRTGSGPRSPRSSVRCWRPPPSQHSCHDVRSHRSLRDRDSLPVGDGNRIRIDRRLGRVASARTSPSRLKLRPRVARPWEPFRSVERLITYDRHVPQGSAREWRVRSCPLRGGLCVH